MPDETTSLPPMIPVASSQISEVGYVPEEQKLYVRFSNGSLYVYSSLPPEMYEALMSAPSIGSFHATNIKYKFPYQRVE